MYTTLQVNLDGAMIHRQKSEPYILEEVRMNIRHRRVGQTLVVDFNSKKAVPDYVRYLFRTDDEDTPVLKALKGRQLYYEPAPFPAGYPIDAYRYKQRIKQVVLVLLESPHEREVTFNLIPRCPAAGATGHLLHQYRSSVAELLTAIGVAPEQPIHVVLVNPVPFPASLRSSHGPIRDKVFKALLKHPSVRQRFHDRLTAHPIAAIINACTAKLQPQVHGEIKAALPNVKFRVYEAFKGELRHTLGPTAGSVPIVQTYHPSSWNSKPPWRLPKQKPGKDKDKT